MISETHRQLDRPRQHAQHFADDGLAGDHRDAPVAAQRAQQEHRVLLEQRQVETEPLPQGVDRLAARLVAEDELRRIAGNDPHQHEDQRQHREQRDARKRQTADQEGGHIPICRVQRLGRPITFVIVRLT